jgi:hypothetical protein
MMERTFTEDLHAVLAHPRAREIVDFIIDGAKREATAAERKRCAEIVRRTAEGQCTNEWWRDRIIREIEGERPSAYQRFRARLAELEKGDKS